MEEAATMENKTQFSSTLFDEPEKITFNNITGEHNYRKCSFLNVLSYISMLLGLSFQLLFLASDIYTLIQIYALHNWSDFHTITYIPILAYKIIFTTCIGISFLYVIFFWVLGVFIERENKVVKTYLHTGARMIDSLKSYERFCIFEEIQTKNFHDWMCLTIYSEYHYDIISWILADTPRQILNGATIAYSVSNRFTSGDIASIISSIAANHKEEAVLLSFMMFSFIVWLCFTVKNVIVIISSICVISATKRRSQMKFGKYCADLVAESVANLYSAKAQLQEEDFSKRRKVPSFLKNENALIDIEEERKLDQSILNFSNDYTSDSIDKSNPFDVELNEIPVSHSRTNLVNKSTTNLHNDGFTSIPFSDDPDDDPFNSSGTNLFTGSLSQNHNKNERPEIDTYEYVPSRVFEEAYHNSNSSPFTTQPFKNNDTNYSIRQATTEDSRDRSQSNTSQSNTRSSNLLYGSRGLAAEPRNVL